MSPTCVLLEVEGLLGAFDNWLWISHVVQRTVDRVRGGSTLAERILLLFCRNKSIEERAVNLSDREYLSQLTASFPDFMEEIRGKDVLDFGCGKGQQLFAMLKRGARRVTGIDTNLSLVQWPAEENFDPAKVSFKNQLDAGDKGQYDLVISQNSMEHFGDPEKILRVMIEALRPDGKLFITFGPPWYAPYGSHMQFFTWLPWVNVFFSEKTVMNVRKNFRKDGARRYEDVPSGLNKMTVAKFERLLRDQSLDVKYRLYKGVKGLDFLCDMPFLRELIVNRISVVVVKRS